MEVTKVSLLKKTKDVCEPFGTSIISAFLNSLRILFMQFILQLLTKSFSIAS